MKPRNAYCSFCRKSYKDVGPLVEGPADVYICAECVQLCQTIIEQEKKRRSPPPQPPSEALIREILDQLINGQEEAKQTLARAASLRSAGKVRVLLIGSSPSASKYLARALAYALDAPFAASDSIGLVPWKQGSIEMPPLLIRLLYLVVRLLEASDFDTKAAETGVVFVDGAQRVETQDALMSLWQADSCRPIEGIQLALGSILFVCGASYDRLDEAFARLGRHPEQPVTIGELTAMGAKPSWSNCLTGIARVAPLDETDLSLIVKCLDFDRLKGMHVK